MDQLVLLIMIMIRVVRHGKVKQSESVSEQKLAIINIANFKDNSGHSKFPMTAGITTVRPKRFRHWMLLMEQAPLEFQEKYTIQI